jgi:hypothetical protein
VRIIEKRKKGEERKRNDVKEDVMAKEEKRGDEVTVSFNRERDDITA